MKPNGNTDETFYPHHTDNLPQKFQEKARLELFEIPENVESRISDVKNLIRKERTMKEEWFSDEAIIMYLRSRKYNVKKAFGSMKKMVAFIKKYREYFEPVDSVVLDEMLEKGVVELIPRRDSEGQTIGILRLGNWDTSKLTAVQFLHCCMLMTLSALNEPMTQINGVKCICDFSKNPLKYVRYMTPFYIYFVYQALLECMPLRIRAINLLNPSIVAKMFVAMINTLASEKLKKRIMIHGEPAEILSYIQSNIVPSEYGGTLPEEERTTYTLAKTLAFPSYITAITEHFRLSKKAD